MAKKQARKRRPKSEPPPRTIGDLRRLLAKLDYPWRPDTRLSDDEPIPEYPTGGDGSKKPPGVLLREGELMKLLKSDQPANPFLRAVWKERGLVGRPPKATRSRRKLPTPRDGG